jgi:capsular polysaccharide export protein
LSRDLTAVAVLADVKGAARARDGYLSVLLGLPVVAPDSIPQDAQIEARAIWADGPQLRAGSPETGSIRDTWWLADGFVRSGGVESPDPALSLLVDDQRSYDDCRGPTRLETCAKRALSDGELERSRHLIEAWRRGRISKWNHHRDCREELPRRYVLVIDQARDDPTIARADAGREHFRRMLQAAAIENPDAAFVVWNPTESHFRWGSRGSLPRMEGVDPSRVTRIKRPAHPARILEQAESVYTVSSHLGFEGLIWGKRVRTFGMPFYAGWSLTEDALAAPSTRQDVSIEQFVHGALVEYSRYVDPETGGRCEVERIIEHLSLQRRMQERFPPVIHAVGFSKWKRPIVRQFFQGSRVEFLARVSRPAPHVATAVWGRGTDAEKSDDAQSALHVEDGFLRSVGLGAQLISPLSWVVDRCGMYYDPSRPSDLEHLLQTAEVTDELCRRAAHLRQKIVAAGITKYNLGVATWRRPATDRRVILVPGQVESDLSIVYGSQSIQTNSDLLSAVRAENPDAYVVFKPHPDVLARFREGDAASLGDAPCDEIVRSEASMAGILGEIDEVHTMTSLAGFEALLRGKRVVAYGVPFYAGWGLTDDKTSVPRRTRRLTLDMLVAGALILYPTYVSRVTGRYTSPERVLIEIEDWRASESRNGSEP